MPVGYRNLYNLGYLHRDISPGNIILVDPNVRAKDHVVDIELKNNPYVLQKHMKMKEITDSFCIGPLPKTLREQHAHVGCLST